MMIKHTAHVIEHPTMGLRVAVDMAVGGSGRLQQKFLAIDERGRVVTEIWRDVPRVMVPDDT